MKFNEEIFYSSFRNELNAKSRNVNVKSCKIHSEIREIKDGIDGQFYHSFVTY